MLENYEAEDINVTITKTDFSSKAPLFYLLITQPDNPNQDWVLEVTGHTASQINFNTIQKYSTIELNDNNSLLLQYTDIQCELYFNSSTTELDNLLLELNQISFRFYDLYQCSIIYFDNLYRTRNGLLAKGSKTLLLQYAEVLNKFKISYNIIGERTPTYWDGFKHASTEELKILILKDSYIIGKDFIFNQIV